MNEFQHLIEDDETIIKIIKPHKKTMTFFPNIFMCICNVYSILVFALMLIFLICFKEPIFLTLLLWALPSILIAIGVYFTINAQYKSALYCITNKRLIIRSGIIGYDFRIFDLESISTVDMVTNYAEKKYGTASIIFHNASNSTFFSGGIMNGQPKNGFMQIENPNEIYKEIKALIKQQKEN